MVPGYLFEVGNTIDALDGLLRFAQSRIGFDLACRLWLAESHVC